MTEANDSAALFRLNGRVAILTGASSGLGVRFARVLHGAGATVVLAARRKDRLDDLAAELPGSIAVACDVANDSDVEQLVAAALEVNGRIDLVVNNAGTSGPMPAQDETPEMFRKIVDVNLHGTYTLCHFAGKQMLTQEHGGVIINIASMLGLVGVGQIPQGSYTASKGAVVNLTRELGAQWARRGVRVNAIAPGWFRTEMTEEMFEDEKSLVWMRRKAPMGRAGEITELDGALLFLAGDASTYVTGQIIAVDGGWTAV